MMEREGEWMSPITETFPFDTKTRREWMAALAKATPEELEYLWSTLKEKPEYYFLRPPEVGLVMVRGRAGGTGMRFNLGEVTMTRCTVQVNGGAAGTAYVLGRNVRHAELAAVLDAMLQDPCRHTGLMKEVVKPMIVSIEDRKRQVTRKAAATKVEFFTMVRGDD
jgi:alpha-D-ribose 1-methylphosphonate 5-triphosphate synthase subunit PhnG